MIIKESENRVPAGRLFTVLLLVCCLACLPGCRTYYAAGSTSGNIPTASTGTEDGSVEGLIAPYRDSLSATMDLVVAELATDLLKEQPECTLGNHVAGIMLSTAESSLGREVDFSVMNYGGLRVDVVSAGDLRVKDAYQISPFENFVVVLELTGAQVRQLLQQLAGYGGWPVQDISYIISDGAAVDIAVRGEPLEDDRTYSMATVDYVANGGDDIGMLKEIPRINTGILLRDAIQASWKASTAAGRKITAQKDGRVRMR